MSAIEMRASDLGELYALLSMYIRTYHTCERDGALLNEVTEKYNAQSGLQENECSPPSLMNIRGAGRRHAFSPDHDEEILRLRQEGLTIRKIAEATDCSVGYVHKLIHEHNVAP